MPRIPKSSVVMIDSNLTGGYTIIMNKILATFIALSVFGFSQLSVAQPGPQELIEPSIEVHDLFGIEGRNFREGITGRNVAMATVRISRIELTKGTSTPSHNHADEEIVLMLEGSAIAYMRDEAFPFGPGEMITIPAYVEHRYEALEDLVTIEVFGPGR